RACIRPAASTSGSRWSRSTATTGGRPSATSSARAAADAARSRKTPRRRGEDVDRLYVGLVLADPNAAWAACGAMSLTGRADGPALLAPPGVVERMTALAASLAELSDVAVDGPALLGERAALAGLSRQGATSCGGATRLRSEEHTSELQSR